MLQIPRAQAEDSGRYTCVAVNEAGEDSIQYDVRVLRESDQHSWMYKHFNKFKNDIDFVLSYLCVLQQCRLSSGGQTAISLMRSQF